MKAASVHESGRLGSWHIGFWGWPALFTGWPHQIAQRDHPLFFIELAKSLYTDLMDRFLVRENSGP